MMSFSLEMMNSLVKMMDFVLKMQERREFLQVKAIFCRSFIEFRLFFRLISVYFTQTFDAKEWCDFPDL